MKEAGPCLGRLWEKGVCTPTCEPVHGRTCAHACVWMYRCMCAWCFRQQVSAIHMSYHRPHPPPASLVSFLLFQLALSWVYICACQESSVAGPKAEAA